MFKEFPELADYGFRVIMKTTGKFHKSTYLGKDAKLVYSNGRKSIVDPDEVDWVLTEKYVTDVFAFKNSSNGRIRVANRKYRVLTSLGRNVEEHNSKHVADFRALSDLAKEDLVPKAQSQSDNQVVYKDLIEQLRKNEANKRAFQIIGITPIDKNGSDRHRKDHRFHLKNGKLVLYTEKQGVKPSPVPAKEKDVSWYNTFMDLFARANKEKLDIDTTGTNIKFVRESSKRALTDSNVSESSYGTMRPDQKTTSTQMKQINFEKYIKVIYCMNPWLANNHIPPTVFINGEEQFENQYTFDSVGEVVRLDGSSLSATQKTMLNKIIRWGSTMTYVIGFLNELYVKTPQTDANSKSMSQIEDTFHKLQIEGVNDVTVGHRLRGRGLKGTGYVRKPNSTTEEAPLTWSRPSRRFNRPFHLREIEGVA